MSKGDTYIHGIHAVRSAVKYAPAQVAEVWLDRARRDARMQRLNEALRNLDVPVRKVERRVLDSLVPDAAHQGVVARYVGPPPRGDAELSRFLDALDEPPFLLILDQVQDPHNLGACMRSAEAAGVDALIAPRDRAVGMTPAVYKVASGAAERLPFFQVTNLARVLRDLKARGIWLIGAAGEAEATLYDADMTGALGIVMGAEGTGMRRLTREACDAVVRIPMRGEVESLNVSAACAVMLFEAVRQRFAISRS